MDQGLCVYKHTSEIASPDHLSLYFYEFAFSAFYLSISLDHYRIQNNPELYFKINFIFFR